MGMDGLPTSLEPGGHTGGSRQAKCTGASNGFMTTAVTAASAGTFHCCLWLTGQQFTSLLGFPFFPINNGLSRLTVVREAE